jgi:hypothetical protein
LTDLLISLFDAVYIPHGLDLVHLTNDDDGILNDAYKHCKVISADGKATELIKTAHLPLICEAMIQVSYYPVLQTKLCKRFCNSYMSIVLGP